MTLQKISITIHTAKYMNSSSFNRSTIKLPCRQSKASIAYHRRLRQTLTLSRKTANGQLRRVRRQFVKLTLTARHGHRRMPSVERRSFTGKCTALRGGRSRYVLLDAKQIKLAEGRVDCLQVRECESIRSRWRCN